MLGLSDPTPTSPSGMDVPRRTRRRLLVAAGFVVIAIASATVTWIHERRHPDQFPLPSYGAGRSGFIRVNQSAPRVARTVDTTLNLEVLPQPEGTPTIIRLMRADRPGCVLILRSDDIARKLDPRASTVTAEIVVYEMDGRRPLYELRRLGPITDTTDLSRADAAGCRPW